MSDEQGISAEQYIAGTRKSLQHLRETMGIPAEDDGSKSIDELSAEIDELADRYAAWEDYASWRQQHRWTWRWRDYRGAPLTLPAPWFINPRWIRESLLR